MTDLEQRAVQALMDMPVGPSRNDRFKVTRLYMVLSSDARWPLKPEEQDMLWSLVWRYRRQICDADVVRTADMVVNQAVYLDC
jgi:hypothetical protein